MAIEYTLLLDTPHTTTEVAQEIITALGQRTACLNTDNLLSFAGARCWVECASQLARTIFREKLRINCDVEVTFRIDKFNNTMAGYEGMLDCLLHFIVTKQHDIAFLANGEKPLVMRIAGKYFLDTTDPFWHERLAERFVDRGIDWLDCTIPVV